MLKGLPLLNLSFAALFTNQNKKAKCVFPLLFVSIGHAGYLSTGNNKLSKR